MTFFSSKYPTLLYSTTFLRKCNNSRTGTLSDPHLFSSGFNIFAPFLICIEIRSTPTRSSLLSHKLSGDLPKMETFLHPIGYSLLTLKKYPYRLHPFRILKFIAFILSLILTCLMITPLIFNSDSFLFDVPKEVPILQSTHTFIHSAYYYPVSKS